MRSTDSTILSKYDKLLLAYAVKVAIEDSILEGREIEWSLEEQIEEGVEQAIVDSYNLNTIDQKLGALRVLGPRAFSIGSKAFVIEDKYGSFEGGNHPWSTTVCFSQEFYTIMEMAKKEVILGNFGVTTEDGTPLYFVYYDLRDPERYGPGNADADGDTGVVYVHKELGGPRYFGTVIIPGLRNAHTAQELVISVVMRRGKVMSYFYDFISGRKLASVNKLKENVHNAILSKVPPEMFEPLGEKELAEHKLHTVVWAVDMSMKHYDIVDFFRNGGSEKELENSISAVVKKNIESAFEAYESRRF